VELGFLQLSQLEITAALNRNIRVIPVLVQGAAMPSRQDLPEALAKLTRRNALELSDARWEFDVDRLSEILQRELKATDFGEIPQQKTDIAVQPVKVESNGLRGYGFFTPKGFVVAPSLLISDTRPVMVTWQRGEQEHITRIIFSEILDFAT
jgi:hypothetical protein